MHRISKKLRPFWGLRGKKSRTKLFRENGRGGGTQKIIQGIRVSRNLRKNNIKWYQKEKKSKNWRLSLKPSSTADLAGVLGLLGIYFKARNSMQSKAATTMGFLAITYTVPKIFAEIQYTVT